MQEKRLLDLDNRKGKAPGGYQSTLAESRLPFIFMNAVGLQRDVETILHEAGHAFHALATREEPLYAYRGSPIEFCEVASMSMELLGNEFLEEFYSTNDANRARRTHLEGIVGIFPWIATVDAFQHWIYTHPNHTRAERSAAWLALMDRFGGNVDWTGYEEARRISGTSSSTFFSTRFTTWNTASRNSAPCKCGRTRSATKRNRWQITSVRSRSATRVRCRNCSPRPAAVSRSIVKR